MGIRDDQLEGGLFEAFKTPQGESVLESIERLHGAGSSILLRDAGEGASPILLRRADDDAAKDDRRYQVLGEIARGGIGVIYKGRDKDLNREVALKVLRAEYAERDDVIQRFIEEAQVGGQLQHPGIVPVYGLGLQEDGRPSFAMKLIKGQTLSELLASNAPAVATAMAGGRKIDLLAVFEQVAQTMAYAHSRGVIHRDLKPANVMVGAFGEVQVVDWGFAKVLGHEEMKPRPEQTVIATVRSEAEGSQSIAGSVMGTPAYMPPEQAMGRIDDLDESSDVFALGAILCEILTGKPPYTGAQKDQLIAATQCRLDKALERLEKAEAAAELKRIVRDCLQPLSEDRPPNARVLAERLQRHFADVEERARTSELDALASDTRAAREQHARRRALALAAIALVAIVGGGGGYVAWKSKRDAREGRARERIATALQEATGHEGERDWTAAVAAARNAVDIAASEGVDDAGARKMLARLEDARAAAEDETRQSEADAKLLAELEEARALHTDHYDDDAIEAAYVAAIRRRWPSQEVDTQRLQRSDRAVAFAAAFDAWARFRRSNDRDWREVDAWARAIDPENNALRDAIAARDGDALEALLANEDLAAMPPARIASIARALDRADKPLAAISLLERAYRLYPNDFWINYRLGLSAWQTERDTLACRHFWATLALQPQSVEARHRLGLALEKLGDNEGALAVWRDALALRPDWTHGLSHVATALARLGKHEEAIAASKTVLRREPNKVTNYIFHAEVQELCGDTPGARETLAEAIKLEPGSARAHRRMGALLTDRLNDHHEAVRFLRKALQLLPDSASTHQNLGVALGRTRDAAGALKHLRRAIELSPHNPSFAASCHNGIGNVLMNKGDFEGAERAFGEAVALDPGHAGYHARLGHARSWQENWRGAVAAYREAARLEPKTWFWWRDLWQGCTALGDFERGLAAVRKAAELNPQLEVFVAAYLCDNLCRWDEAIAEFGKILEKDPRHAYAHNNSGVALKKKREYAKAIEWQKKGIALAPNDAVLWRTLADTLEWSGDLEGALQAYRKAAELAPGQPKDGVARLERYFAWRKAGEPTDLSPADRATIARVLRHTERHALTARFYREAFAGDPSLRMKFMYSAMRVAVQAGEEWRAQALAWLRFWLGQRVAQADTHPGGVMADLLNLTADPYFAPVRDADDLAPEWRRFWADVDALIARIVEAAR